MVDVSTYNKKVNSFTHEMSEAGIDQKDMFIINRILGGNLKEELKYDNNESSLNLRF